VLEGPKPKTPLTGKKKNPSNPKRNPYGESPPIGKKEKKNKGCVTMRREKKKNEHGKRLVRGLGGPIVGGNAYVLGKPPSPSP